VNTTFADELATELAQEAQQKSRKLTQSEVAEKIAAKLGKKAKILARLADKPNLKSVIERLDDGLDTKFLNNIDNLDDVQLGKLDNLYANIKAPTGMKGKGNFTVNFNGYDVYYDKFGFPDFRQYSTPTTKGKVVFKKQGKLNGDGKDMTSANEWAKKNFSEDDFIPLPNGTCKIRDPKTNEWIDHTWHHHQDAKTMFPVPSKIHNSIGGGANHSGGTALIKRELDGIDIFESPKF
jgi:hypothetical protein